MNSTKNQIQITNPTKTHPNHHFPSNSSRENGKRVGITNLSVTSLTGASTGELSRRGDGGEERVAEGEGELLDLGGGRRECAGGCEGGRGGGGVQRRGEVAAESQLAQGRRTRVREGVRVRRRR